MDSESPIPELKIRRASREDALAGDPLAEFHVFWFDIIEADLTAYRDVMDAATDERALQRHLTDNPILLSQILDGGHGRWCCRIKTLADGRTRTSWSVIVGQGLRGNGCWPSCRRRYCAAPETVRVACS
jgi:hypothetical protein